VGSLQSGRVSPERGRKKRRRKVGRKTKEGGERDREGDRKREEDKSKRIGGTGMGKVRKLQHKKNVQVR